MKKFLPFVRFLSIAWVLYLGSIQISCSGDSCTLNCNGDLRFPLVVGYSWQYRGEDRISNFRPDSDTIVATITDSAEQYVLTVTITGSDTLSDGTIVHILHEVKSSGDSLIDEGYQYYSNNIDGLYYFADLSSGNSLLQFKMSAAAGTNNPQMDFARKSLEYPILEGLEWEYTNGFGYGPAGAIYKRVIGIGEQTVSAGKYECYAIAWIWENLAGAERTEYLADVGLVRIRTVYRDLRYTTQESPEGIGLVDVTTELQLTRTPFN